MIIKQRDALGPRVVVIGGGDSRDTTQSAINSLLNAGIPFIAPNLLADFGAPGRPFVDRPGYLQLAPPNLAYATDTAARLADEFPDGYRLDIYQQPNATDLYTTSLVNDLLAAVAPNDRASARHVVALDRIDETICEGGDGPPTVIYFADRWTRFADFVQRIKEVCGHARPRLVVADGSVSRFMANYQMRAVSMADWPVDYYIGGPGCSALTQPSLDIITDQVQHFHELFEMTEDERFTCADRAPEAAASGELRDACTLDAAAKMTSQPCLPNDLGGFLLPAWDAVILADALLPSGGGDRPAPADYLAGLRVADLQLSTTGSRATVADGRLLKATVPVLLWHVDPLNDPARVWERPSPTLLLPAEKNP
jgi:hypothetical protein